MQLGLNSRGGPLSLDERGAVGEDVTRAGDRAPDAQLTDAHGAPVRLFDVFRGGHFTLLAFGGAEPPALDEEIRRAVRSYCVVPAGHQAADDTTLIDANGQAHRIYGDGLIVIRPDGYLGYAGPAGGGGVQSWLARFFGCLSLASRQQPLRATRRRGSLFGLRNLVAPTARSAATAALET